MSSDTEEELINAAKMNGSPVLGLVKFSQNFLIKSFCHSLNLIQSCVGYMYCHVIFSLLLSLRLRCIVFSSGWRTVNFFVSTITS